MGIRAAVAGYIQSEKKKFYAAAIAEAARDADFAKRLAEVQNDFSAIDAEDFHDNQ